jgi:hypothetical protein
MTQGVIYHAADGRFEALLREKHEKELIVNNP